MKFFNVLNEKIKFDKSIDNYMNTDLESYKDYKKALKCKKSYCVWIRPVRMKISSVK